MFSKFKIKYLNIIGIILLFYIIFQIGLENIVNAFYNIDLFYLFLSIVLIFPIAMLKGLKWWQIAKTHEVDFSFRDSCIIYLIGQYFGFLTPGRLGEAVKVLYVKEKSQSLGKALSTTIIDRFMDLLTLLIFSVFGTFYLTTVFINELFLQLFILLIVFMVLVLLFLKKSFLVKVLKPIHMFLIPKRFKEYVSKHFNEFYEELISFSKKYASISFLLLISIIIWLVLILQGYFLALSLNIEITYLYYAAITPIVIIVTLLPITISGIGTREISFIFFFSMIGITAEKTVAFSILSMVITYWSYALIGGTLWFKKPLEIEKRQLLS